MTKAAATVGRPRQSGVITDSPREEILAAAAELFINKGFGATKMKEIALASGLQQPSLYYWFRSKDEILRAIMEKNRASLLAARAVSDSSAPAAARLYIVLFHDVVQMCLAPLDFFDLESAAHNQPDVFFDFHADYKELLERLSSIIESGIASGDFIDLAPEEYARVALSLNEGLQHRFHAVGRTAEPGTYADEAATVSIRALLTDVTTMGAITEAARAGVNGFQAVVPPREMSNDAAPTLQPQTD